MGDENKDLQRAADEAKKADGKMTVHTENILSHINDSKMVNINSAFFPVTVQCPKCSAEVTTECKYKIGIWNMCQCLCGGWQFFCAPVWFKWYRDVTHVCPKCQAEICHVSKCPFCIKTGDAVANEANAEAKNEAKAAEAAAPK
uniref:LITAF domain-containing protein n=1 Tax=Panagrolaimus sp. JU765 TaxID=591449 RepID=A0AC34QPF3_9BILA